MRMPDIATADVPEDPADGLICDGVLWFGDGSLKGLASFHVWLGLLHCWHDHLSEIQDPLVVLLISSLMKIPTILKSSEIGLSKADSAIHRIVKQNQAAKTQAVSSFAWASILLSLKDTSTASFDELLDRYENHPEVISASDDSTGTGSISMKGRMRFGVKNWVEKTCDLAWAEVEHSTHDIPFGMGCFGEFGNHALCFVGSTVGGLANDPSCELAPLDGEAFFTIDWSLPLTDHGQGILFKKSRCSFDTKTGIVPVSHKSKYRNTDDELFQLRSIAALWSQFKPHALTKLPVADVDAWELALVSSASRDDDFVHILQSKPKNLALSMLQSNREVAHQQLNDKQQELYLMVETSRCEVRTAKFNYFVAALKRDQLLLEQTQHVPIKVKQMEHKKLVKERTRQASNGEKAVLGYLQKFLKVTAISKIELLQQEIMSERSKIATRYNHYAMLCLMFGCRLKPYCLNV
jgi:hypothetical protein